MEYGKLTDYRKIILSVIIFFVLVYIISRAYLLSFTHDECVSFKIIEGDKEVGETANNHLLNTWMMFLFYQIFGGREIALRMPNILAFIVYSYYTYKILIKSSNIIIILLGASLLLMNPYITDFFGLARGYGLSLGFGAGAMYYLLKEESYSTYKLYIKGLITALLFSLLSAYSNLNCISFNISVMIVFIIELLIMRQNRITEINRKRIQKIIAVLILDLIFLSYIIKRSLTLQAQNKLNFGGTEDFINNILSLLVHSTIYTSYYGETIRVIINLIVITTFTSAIIYQINGQRNSEIRKTISFLLLMVIAMDLQHYLFNTNYPPERSSLIFIVIFSILFIYLIEEINKRIISRTSIKRAFNIIVLIIFCLPSGLHFIRSLNLKYTLDWRYDSNTRSMMKTLIEEHREGENRESTITISNDWYYEPSINYYRRLYSMNYIRPANREGVDNKTDYIYKEYKENQEQKILLNYRILKEYKDSRSVLMKRK